MIDEQKLNTIRGKIDRYQFGKTIEIAANYKFLIGVIDELKSEIARRDAEHAQRLADHRVH